MNPSATCGRLTGHQPAMASQSVSGLSLSHLPIFGTLLLVLAACQPAAAQVYRDRVEPQWLTDQVSFWYRVQTAEAGYEFVLADGASGVRKSAFDHAVVAQKLSELLKRDVDASQLPIQRLEYSDDRMTVTLIGPEGRFVYTPATSELSLKEPGEADATELFLPPRPSEDAGDDSEIVAINKLSETLELVWISPSGDQVSYGEVKPGETRRQHTFAGHIWMVRKMTGDPIGCLQAGNESTNLVVTQKTVDSVRQEERRRQGRGRTGRRQRPTAENSSSPNDAFTAIVRDHNLVLIAKNDQSETVLTTDATATNSFRRDASRSRSVGMNYDQPDFPDHIADVHWSPDSQFVVAMQTTQVDERRVHYVETAPREQLQPLLQSYPYQKPGDPIPRQIPRLFRLSDGKEIPVSTDLFPNAWSLDFQRWNDDESGFYLLYNERGHQRLRLLEVTLETGHVRTVIDEHSDTFLHYSSDGKFELRWLPDGQVLWASERSGWNHLYRYNLRSGDVVNAVTTGEWNVRRIERIDESVGIIWFVAVGVRSGQDPYHEHFCRCNLDGTGLVILTEGDGMHTIDWSPNRKVFVDRYSRVDLPPVHELRTEDGTLLCQLEAADASELIKARGSLPERFVAKGRDGITDIYGIVHRPKDFDPSKSYPVIENIYAGPHDYHVPKAFREQYRHQQQIADRGFIVVQIDGMGTAWRSKVFHDVCYRNLRDAGFPDRIAWMKALKNQIPAIDLSRVGIYGGSAGGQNALAALLWHGDFYKAAVADCGCHDNRMDKIWWNEQWMGIPEGDHYPENSNMEHAHQLQGKLMLVVGELDRNVDPATSFQVAKRLVDAGKDFDFVVVPGAGHGACETPWASRKRLNFFASAFLPN